MRNSIYIPIGLIVIYAMLKLSYVPIDDNLLTAIRGLLIILIIGTGVYEIIFYMRTRLTKEQKTAV